MDLNTNARAEAKVDADAKPTIKARKQHKLEVSRLKRLDEAVASDTFPKRMLGPGCSAPRLRVPKLLCI